MVNEGVIVNKRADYDKQIVVALLRQLETKYRSNFEEKNLLRMLQFNTQFTDIESRPVGTGLAEGASYL